LKAQIPWLRVFVEGADRRLYPAEDRVVKGTKRMGSALALFALAISVPPCAHAQSFAVRQVRVFDGELLHTDMTVVVRDGVIQSVQADAVVPPGIEVIDGTGQTLLPGLFQSHGHMGDRGGGSMGDMGDRELTQALAFGVTTALDMAATASWAAFRRDEQRQGTATGRADLLSAGFAIKGSGARFRPGEPPPISRPEEAEEAVEHRLAQGSDYIKTGFLDAVTMDAVIAETHRRDRLVLVHVGTLEDARSVIGAGADGIAHLFWDHVADAEFLTLMQERGAFVIPTLSPFAAGKPGASALVAHTKITSYLSADDIQFLLVVNAPARTNEFFDTVATSLRMLADRGVPILAGSDTPNGQVYGASMHRELELMVQAGLSPTAALRAATSVPARIFSLDDRGRIAPGLRADLLLVDGDPTADILATRNIVAIWKEGVRFDREAYRTALRAERP
jgi:imidazolonepropionase-like amidohydrolase